MVFLVSGASKKFFYPHTGVVELINDENLAYALQKQIFVGRGITVWISTALKTFWKDSNVIFMTSACYGGSTGDFRPQRIIFGPTLPEDRAPNKAFK